MLRSIRLPRLSSARRPTNEITVGVASVALRDVSEQGLLASIGGFPRRRKPCDKRQPGSDCGALNGENRLHAVVAEQQHKTRQFIRVHLLLVAGEEAELCRSIVP
jgi:hypothetical protein